MLRHESQRVHVRACMTRFVRYKLRVKIQVVKKYREEVPAVEATLPGSAMREYFAMYQKASGGSNKTALEKLPCDCLARICGTHVSHTMIERTPLTVTQGSRSLCHSF